MTKNEFLQLFELNEIYEQHKNKKDFGFGLFLCCDVVFDVSLCVMWV